MTNEGILDIVKQCNLSEGKVLIPDKAYHFDQEFNVSVSDPKGKIKIQKERNELIVLVEEGIKVGAVYRMENADIHVVIDEEYRGKHIMSDFLKTGIVNRLWPKIKSVELCGVYTWREYEKKKHLAQLCHMTIKNAEEIEKHLQRIDECKARYGTD